MKLLVNGLLIIALLLAKTPSAQNLKVEKSRLLDYKSMKYIGSNSMFHFFSTEKEDKSYLVKADVNDINKIEEERIRLREPDIAEIFICDSNLFYITYSGKPARFIYSAGGMERIESTLTGINFYKYNSYTNNLISRQHLDLEEEEINPNDILTVYVNIEKRFIRLTAENYYDFNFEQTEDIELNSKNPNLEEKAFQISTNKNYGGGVKPYFKDYKKEPGSSAKMINAGPFSIQYTENTDNSVAVLKSSLADVKIVRNTDKNIKGKIQLPGTKIMIDLYGTTTPDNSLIVLGKYCEKKDDKVIYGFFTAKYDPNLSVTMDIVYSPVIETDKKQKNLDKQAFANLFFVTSQSGFNHALIGNKSQFFFYQFWDTKIRGIVNYEVVAEDIYAIMIDSSGAVKLKKNPLSQNSRLLGYCRPVLVGNEKDFYLIYYDHKANIETAGNKQPVECNLNVANTVMVSHKIDVEKVEMGEKSVIFNCKDSQFIPETTWLKAITDGSFKDKMAYLTYSNGIIYQFTFE